MGSGTRFTKLMGSQEPMEPKLTEPLNCVKRPQKTLVMGLRKEIMKDKFYLIQDYYVSLKMAL